MRKTTDEQNLKGNHRLWIVYKTKLILEWKNLESIVKVEDTILKESVCSVEETICAWKDDSTENYQTETKMKKR